MQGVNISLVVLFLISYNFTYSQQRGTQPHPSFEKPNKPKEKLTTLNKSFPENKLTKMNKKLSSDENNLISQLRNARHSGDKKEMSRLRNELNKIHGVVRKQGEQVGYIKKAETTVFQGDNIDITQIHFGSNVQAITTVTEQIGENTGRIWTIVISNLYDGADYSLMYFYYSDDNGINWTGYASAFNPYELGVSDAIDAEIIEDYTGTKYLYVAYGAKAIDGGKYMCNLLNLTISGSVDGSVHRLEWPGFEYFGTDVNYYKPRITTDNAFWTGAAYLYIAACQDSVDEMQTNFGEKVAFLDDPYTANPAINYKPEILSDYSYDNGDFNGCCDIAWFDDPENGGGSVMLVESGAYFTTALYLYETQDVNFLGTPTHEGYLDPDGIVKSSAYIASNGLYENLMIVNVNEYDPEDNDIQYFTTVDAGDTWTDGFVSYTFDNDYRADVTGLRNVPGNYYSAHADFNNFFDNVFYSVARDNLWSAQVVPVNHIDASVDVSPRPGIKLGGDDSCFVVWTEWANNANMWSSAGCDGSPTLNRSFTMGLYIEGYYDPSTYYLTRNDTITVSFCEDYSPYNIIDSKKLLLNENGYFLLFSNIIDVFTDYYVVVNHRNSIETWSASPINFNGGNSYYYEFISSNTQAYGNNEKYLGTDGFTDYYGIYSGDIDQNGSVESSDLSIADNDAFNFVSGYVNSDVNGDNVVDNLDLGLVDNNVFNFVNKVTPP